MKADFPRINGLILKGNRIPTQLSSFIPWNNFKKLKELSKVGINCNLEFNKIVNSKYCSSLDIFLLLKPIEFKIMGILMEK